MLFVAADLPDIKHIAKEIENKWGDKYEIYHGKVFRDKKQCNL